MMKMTLSYLELYSNRKQNISDFGDIQTNFTTEDFSFNSNSFICYENVVHGNVKLVLSMGHRGYEFNPLMEDFF
jgi:uncharacterized membrane protein